MNNLGVPGQERCPLSLYKCNIKFIYIGAYHNCPLVELKSSEEGGRLEKLTRGMKEGLEPVGRDGTFTLLQLFCLQSTAG